MALTIPEIEKLARDEGERLRKTSRWAAAYRGAEPEAPLLVRAKPPIRDYYIVEFRQGSRTTGVMLLNALSGKVGSITGIQKPTDTMFRFVRPNEVPDMIERYGRALKPGVAINPANIKVQPELVWEPCDQSLTPFKPFYRVEHVRPDGVDVFFVRVDGEIYPQITHGGAGM